MVWTPLAEGIISALLSKTELVGFNDFCPLPAASDNPPVGELEAVRDHYMLHHWQMSRQKHML